MATTSTIFEVLLHLDGTQVHGRPTFWKTGQTVPTAAARLVEHSVRSFGTAQMLRLCQVAALRQQRRSFQPRELLPDLTFAEDLTGSGNHGLNVFAGLQCCSG